MKPTITIARQQTPDELIAQISQLMDEAEALLVGPFVEKASEKLGDIRTRLKNAQVRLVEIYGAARLKIIAGARYTDDSIRENPYQWLAMALGIGVLLGALLRRGNS